MAAQKKASPSLSAKTLRRLFFSGISLLLLVALVFSLLPLWRNHKAYQEASALMAQGYYEEAVSVFTPLLDYRDSRELILECRYRHGQELLQRRNYSAAIELFQSLPDYKDSAVYLSQAEDALIENGYQRISALLNAGAFHSARQIYDSLCAGYPGRVTRTWDSFLPPDAP